MRILPALVSTSNSPFRVVFSEGNNGPQISHFSSRRSSNPQGRRCSSSTCASLEASTTMRASGSYSTPSMMMPPLFCSKPPHCTRACVPRQRCSIERLNEIVLPLGTTSVAFLISPEKFMAWFSAVVSNVCVISLL